MIALVSRVYTEKGAGTIRVSAPTPSAWSGVPESDQASVVAKVPLLFSTPRVSWAREWAEGGQWLAVRILWFGSAWEKSSRLTGSVNGASRWPGALKSFIGVLKCSEVGSASAARPASTTRLEVCGAACGECLRLSWMFRRRPTERSLRRVLGSESHRAVRRVKLRVSLVGELTLGSSERSLRGE